MKNDIRNFAKSLRKELNTIELSKKIHNNLFTTNEWKNSYNIFTYYSVGNEVDTINLLKEDKNWYIPRIKDNNLFVCPYNQSKLKINKYKVPESTEKDVTPNCIDMIIIPALAADKSGYRIGYGGGYYDRFISSLKKDIFKVVLIYSDLFFDSVPHNNLDQKCDMIITDKEIYKVNC